MRAVLDAYTAFDMFAGWIVVSTAFDKRYPSPTPLEHAPLEPLRADLKEVLNRSERTIGLPQSGAVQRDRLS